MAKEILKGFFTSDGTDHVLETGVEVQYLKLINITQAAATNNGYGYEHEWTQDMGTASYQTYHPAGDNTAANTYIATGINQVDSSNYAIGAAVATTTGTNVTAPVYETADTTGLSTGSVVRIQGVDQVNLHGMDFTVDTVVLDTSFAMQNDLATAPGIVAGAGFYRVIAPNRQVYDAAMSQNKVGGYVPGKRIIVNISQAAAAVVTVAVDHGYQVKQRIRLNVPASHGMTQMNGLEGTITAVTAGTFTVNINSSTFDAFNFPEYDVPEFTNAFSIPNGDTFTIDAEGRHIPFYGGSSRNIGFKGFVLTAGTALPAGNNGDVIKWIATKAADVVTIF